MTTTTERAERVAEINERNRRIYEAAQWAERHRVTPAELLEAVERARDRKQKLGRPLSLAEIADCFPTKERKK